MLDKSKRVESMMEALGAALGLDAVNLATAQQAAPLATADLATAMVMEFTSLAGVMGRHYALREGQPAPVSLILEFVIFLELRKCCFQINGKNYILTVLQNCKRMSKIV
jgi:hypothetical protein